MCDQTGLFLKKGFGRSVELLRCDPVVLDWYALCPGLSTEIDVEDLQDLQEAVAEPAGNKTRADSQIGNRIHVADAHCET